MAKKRASRKKAESLSRAERIRRRIKAKPNEKAVDTAKALRVGVSQVYMERRKMFGGKRTEDEWSMLRAGIEFVEVCGSVEKAKQVLERLSKLA